MGCRAQDESEVFAVNLPRMQQADIGSLFLKGGASAAGNKLKIAAMTPEQYIAMGIEVHTA